MSASEIKNAKIYKVTIELEDGPGLICELSLCYGLTFQAFRLDAPSFAGIWITRVLELCEAKNLNELKGKCLRVRGNDQRIEAIGHIVMEDWFDPGVELFGNVRGGAK